LQRHIELQQQQKTHLVQNATKSIKINSVNANNKDNDLNRSNPDRKQLVLFNPVGSHPDMEVVEEVVYEPELTKDPVVVTDVTSKDLTVTISECRTPEGFFRT